MDTFLMPKVGSYRYVLHARCALISWPEWRATTSEYGKVIGMFIFGILCRWGGMAEIITDNAAPYTAGADWLCKTYHINHIRISGYNYRINGIIESKHFDVREAIMKTCEGTKSKWRQVLPQVFWAERITIHKATGYSPYYMAHGVHPLLPFNIVEATYLAPKQDFGVTTEELIAIRARQLAKCPEDIANMQEKVTAYRRKAIEHFEKDHISRIKDFDFSPGDLVLLRNSRIKESLNRKTKPRYIGPMLVVCRKRNTSYVIAELDGAQSQQHVAGFRLIPYFLRHRTEVPIVSNIPDEDQDDTGRSYRDSRLL